jgi:hypothetical protein
LIVLAIDPGTDESACVLWDGGRLIAAFMCRNQDMRDKLLQAHYDKCAIEMVACYGMAVGKSVFETCLWIGRFIEMSMDVGPDEQPELIYRRDVKLHHCQSARAKDANVRQALIDKYGEPGKKGNPGLTYGLKSHLWQAFAIATYITERR